MPGTPNRGRVLLEQLPNNLLAQGQRTNPVGTILTARNTCPVTGAGQGREYVGLTPRTSQTLCNKACLGAK